MTQSGRTSWFRRLFGSKSGSRVDSKPAGASVAVDASDAKGFRIAVGATGDFPVYSHTFVYQEIASLREAFAATVRMHFRSHGPGEHLHGPYAFLEDGAEQISLSWEEHRDNYLEYRERMPEKVDAIAQRIADAAKMSREDIEREFEFLAAFTFCKLIEPFAPNYIHTYFFYEWSLYGLVAGLLFDVPRGVSAYADHVMGDWHLKLLPLHLETASVLVATSARIKGELEEVGEAKTAADADKIIVKPNAVDGRRFPRAVRSVAEGRPIRMISVSRIEPKKGLLDLVQVVEALHALGHPVHLRIVGTPDPATIGSDEYAQSFLAAVENSPARTCFEMMNFRTQDEIRELLGDSDLFIAPYVETESGNKDGIPTAILEAIATGLPIVTTNAGSITEVVRDGMEGRVLPQRDPQAFVDAIRAFQDDPASLLAMNDAARARFEAEFDTAVCERRLHDRVRAAVAASRPSYGAGLATTSG